MDRVLLALGLFLGGRASHEPPPDRTEAVDAAPAPDGAAPSLSRRLFHAASEAEAERIFRPVEPPLTTYKSTLAGTIPRAVAESLEIGRTGTDVNVTASASRDDLDAIASLLGG